MILVCVVQDKMHLYRLRLVVNLLTNEANNAREKIMKACSMWRMRVVALLLVAIYKILKVSYERQCQREGKDNVSIYNHGLIYLFITSVCHSAPIGANAIMHDGTIVETFVRENLVGFVELLSLPLSFIPWCSINICGLKTLIWFFIPGAGIRSIGSTMAALRPSSVSFDSFVSGPTSSFDIKWRVWIKLIRDWISMKSWSIGFSVSRSKSTCK